MKSLILLTIALFMVGLTLILSGCSNDHKIYSVAYTTNDSLVFTTGKITQDSAYHNISLQYREYVKQTLKQPMLYEAKAEAFSHRGTNQMWFKDTLNNRTYHVYVLNYHGDWVRD